MDKEMEQIHGHVRKMIATAESPVSYRLPIGDVELPLNAFLGKTMCIEYTGAITCIACGQRTKKSFHQGYCFRCFRTLARCDLCMVKPELCHFAQGTCRERSEEHTSELQSLTNLVCRLLLEKKTQQTAT